MLKYFKSACFCLFLFFTACLFRYNLLSLIYLVFLLLLPWFQCPNKHTIKGRTVHVVADDLIIKLICSLACLGVKCP